MKLLGVEHDGTRVLSGRRYARVQIAAQDGVWSVHSRRGRGVS